MAKHLRTITEDKRLEGVKGSKIEDAEVYGGKDASINTNDPSTVKFVKKHKIDKHEDRVGNGPDVYAGKTKKTTKYNFQSPDVYEETEELDEKEDKESFDYIMNKAIEQRKKNPKKYKPIAPVIDKSKTLRFSSDLKKKPNLSEETEDLEEKYMGFQKTKQALAAKGAKNPAALAAWIGRKKYGKAKFQKAAAADHKMKGMKEDLDEADFDYVAEAQSCNQTEAGVMCPEHGLNDCSGKTGKAKHLLLDKDKKMNEATDTPEESSMVRTELRAIADKAEEMLKMLKTDMHIEPWVQAKIANAKGMICGCHDYMKYGEMDESVQIDEMPSVRAMRNTSRTFNVDKQHQMQKDRGFGKSFKQPGTSSKSDLRSAAEKALATGKITKLPAGKAKGIKEDEQIDEVLTKKTPVSTVIHDFVHSDDPKFKGKSKKERQRMALGAYYSMHPEKSKKVHEDAAEPMLEGGKKKKKTQKESGPDTPIKSPPGSSYPDPSASRDAPVNV